MKPSDEQQLAEAIASAQTPLDIRGGGTRQLGRRVDGEVLETSGLTGITLYEPGALTIVAKAGTPLAEIEAALASENQRLPFEPTDMRALYGATGQSTIGGVVATNSSGPRRIQAGACRDSLIGVRFVDGQGQILKNGGRVMKNVTGYDLVKLMAGSHGTLGVLSEVSFKVLPAPEATATLFVTCLSDEEAVKVMSKALGSPFDVSGAAHAPACIEEEPTTMIRVEGFENSVNYRIKRLKKLLGRYGSINVSQGAESWAATRDVIAFAASVRPGYLWRLSVKPSDGPRIIEDLAQSLHFKYFYDWAGGLIWLHCDCDDVMITELQRSKPFSALQGAMEMHHTLQHFLTIEGGHATLIRGPQELSASVPVFQPESKAIKLLNEGLRMKFDPRNILNTGRM